MEVGGCGDVGETTEESCFFIHQIHTHTLKTYIHPPLPPHTLHTLTITVASPVKLLPLTASFWASAFRMVSRMGQTATSFEDSCVELRGK